jgi:hypothetical protein
MALILYARIGPFTQCFRYWNATSAETMAQQITCMSAANLDFEPQTLNYTCAYLGPHTINMSVTDEHGNTATCTAVVTVADNILPVARCQNRLDH